MSHEPSLDHASGHASGRAPGDRFPTPRPDTSHASGRVLALALPLVLQACSGSTPTRATMASLAPPATGSGDGTAAQGTAHGSGSHAPQAPIVRISLGSYPPEREHEVAALLDYTNRSIGEDIQRLDGLVSYYSGIDRARHAIVNVSLWRDVPSAEQMSKLQAMLDLGAKMSRLGVQFVRPIPNFEPIWTFTSAAP